MAKNMQALTAGFTPAPKAQAQKAQAPKRKSASVSKALRDLFVAEGQTGESNALADTLPMRGASSHVWALDAQMPADTPDRGAWGIVLVYFGSPVGETEKSEHRINSHGSTLRFDSEGETVRVQVLGSVRKAQDDADAPAKARKRT